MVNKAAVAKGVGAFFAVKRLVRLGMFLATAAAVLKVLQGRAAD